MKILHKVYYKQKSLISVKQLNLTYIICNNQYFHTLILNFFFSSQFSKFLSTFAKCIPKTADDMSKIFIKSNALYSIVFTGGEDYSFGWVTVL